MTFKFNGKQFSVNVSKYKKRGTSASASQQKLGDILEEIYPNIVIYEEVPCVGTKLRLDFYIKIWSLAFEFDGEQHKQYNPFFHGNRANFVRSQNRDNIKQVWCDQNDIRLIRIDKNNLSKEGVLEAINE